MRRKREPLEPDRCARLLRAIAEPERLRIVQSLRGGPKNVSEIAAELGDELVKVSHHVRILAHAGIVTSEKLGRFVRYELAPDIFRGSVAEASADQLDFGCCRIELPIENIKKSR